MSNNEVITYGSEIHVTIDDRDVKIAKLGLLSYAKMSGILKGLIASVFQAIQEQANWTTEDTAPENRAVLVADLVAKLVETNVVAVIDFLDVCVPDLGRAYIEEKVGLYDTIVLVDGILKVNNINKAIDSGKKLLANYLATRTN
jgi:hypothetical protein